MRYVALICKLQHLNRPFDANPRKPISVVNTGAKHPHQLNDRRS